MMQSLEATDAASKAVQKTPNRVSLDSLKEKMDKIQYIHPDICPHMTIALVKMKNGFIVIGESAPADPENFNYELGCQFALENAIRKIWPLEGYALCEKLSQNKE